MYLWLAWPWFPPLANIEPLAEEAPHETTLSTQPSENTKPVFTIWQAIAGCGLPIVVGKPILTSPLLNHHDQIASNPSQFQPLLYIPLNPDASAMLPDAS